MGLAGRGQQQIDKLGRLAVPLITNSLALGRFHRIDLLAIPEQLFELVDQHQYVGLVIEPRVAQGVEQSVPAPRQGVAQQGGPQFGFTFNGRIVRFRRRIGGGFEFAVERSGEIVEGGLAGAQFQHLPVRQGPQQPTLPQSGQQPGVDQRRFAAAAAANDRQKLMIFQTPQHLPGLRPAAKEAGGVGFLKRAQPRVGTAEGECRGTGCFHREAVHAGPPLVSSAR